MQARLRPDRAAHADEPGPHPARLHQVVHRRARSSRTSARASGRPHATSRRPRRPAHRGHRPRRRRRRHRAVERGRSRRCSACPRSSCPRAASAGRSTRSCSTPSLFEAPRRPRRRGDREQGRARCPAGHRRTLERGLARHGIPLLGVLPYRPILSNPTLGDGPRGRPRRDAPPRPGPRPRSSAASRSGRWSRATCSSGSARGRWSSCPATART